MTIDRSDAVVAGSSDRPDATGDAGTAPPSRARRWLKIAGILLLIGGGVAAVRFFGLASKFLALADQINALGFWAPAVYVLLYAVATVAFVPGSLLTLAAGAIFGLAKGGVVVFTGAVLGSCAAFLVSRYVARGAIERRLEGNEKFAAIDRAIGERGFFITMLLRLSPVFPFNLLNYGLGLTKVPFRDYALASVGMIPGTILYVYYGVAVGSIAKIAEGEAGGGTGQYVLLAFGLAATLVVTVLITRTARRALKEATDESDGGEG